MITNLETRAMVDCCRRKVRSAVVPAIFAVMLMAAPFCRGQNSNTGEIKGLVTDATGSVVPGATVRISNVQTGLTTTTTTNQDGLYDAPSLELGEYSISFSRAGFRDYVRNGVVLQLTTIAINGVLEVGTATEKVIVTEAVPLLETEQSDQSLSIDAVAVQNAPIVGGDWRNELTNVIPGVNGGGGQSASGQSFGVNGTQGYMGNWLLEGAIATDPRDNNSSNNFPPVDAIGQVKINSSNYGAQYGNGVNAVNVILKSGANRWHGSAFEFIQNNAFNAKNYFQRGASAPLRWNEFGGSVGGAIIRDKLFFYFTYQRNPSTTSVVSILTVPTQAIRNGDFSALPTTIYNPNTTVCAGPGNTNCSRTPFAGNTIPKGQIDPVAAAIQGYLPLPNLPGNVNNYSAVATTPGLNQWYVGKVDYNISDANRLSGSVLGFPTANTSGADAFCALGFDCTKSTTLNVAGQITDTWTINSRLLNEARIAALRELDKVTPPTLGKGYPAKIGLQPAYGNNAPGDIFPSITADSGGGLGQVAIGPGTHAILGEGGYTESDVVTLIRGRHTIKIGGEFDKDYQNYTNWGDVSSGSFTFNGIATYNFGATDPRSGQASTGIPYADFLEGGVYGWSLNEYATTGARMWDLGIFAQDDYQVTPQLVLNLGVRYQRQSGWSEVQNRWGTFDPTLVNTGAGLPANTLGAILYGGQQGRKTIQGGVNEFAPRIGFAWSPRNTLAVRGSYGIFDAPRPAETYTDGALGLGLNPTGTFGFGTLPAFQLQSGPPAGSVIYPTAATLTNSEFNGQAVTYYPKSMPIQYYQEVLLSVQKQFPGQILLDTSYVLTKGTHLNFERDIDQVPENLLSLGTAAQPYTQFKSIQGALFDGYSNYNSLQFRLEKRTSHGLTFLANYSWSKTMDSGTSSGHGENVDIWQNAYNISANYGLSQLDATNTWTGSGTYEVPIGQGRTFALHGIVDQALGGWRVSTTFQAHSGIPFTPTISTADLSNSQANACGCDYGWFPNVVGNPVAAHPSVNGWFNTAAFVTPAPNTFGDERRNLLRGPAWRDVDLSLGKRFTLPEGVNFEIRADATDVLNNPNFEQPSGGVGVGVSGAGIITGANTFRSIQLGGRFTF